MDRISNDPYNKGDAYEEKIFQILKQLGWLAPGFTRAGAGGGIDAVFVHNAKMYNLEIKNGLSADYGQKYFKWRKERDWFWAVNDEATEFYTTVGALDYLNKKKIIPNKLRKSNSEITIQDKKNDQAEFEDREFEITIDALRKYYNLKKCFYIQVGGFGFYHIGKDIANLGTEEFDGKFILRFRAKTIRSEPVWNYGFLAVLRIKAKPTQSKFSLDPNDKQKLPPIHP